LGLPEEGVDHASGAGAFSASPTGVPVLSPEVVLLFKTKSPREKDECDFQNMREALDASRKQWLQDSLNACDPNHLWTRLLAGDGRNQVP